MEVYRDPVAGNLVKHLLDDQPSGLQGHLPLVGKGVRHAIQAAEVAGLRQVQTQIGRVVLDRLPQLGRLQAGAAVHLDHVRLIHPDQEVLALGWRKRMFELPGF
jgi:hypothetical protein